jgi:DNA-binding NarL/FixJ family response regulator
MALRVILAEDSYLLREGAARLLATAPEVEVVGTCGDLDSLLSLVDEQQPHVVVTDIRMPPGSADEGIVAANRLRETHPAIGVVVLSQHLVPSYALRLLEGGSAGRAYLLKERVADLDQLLGAIRVVAEGGSAIDPKVVDALVQARSAAERSPLAELTPREREVLAEMAQGRNNAAIAKSLVLSEGAVEKHINAIFSKLGLTWEQDVHRRVRAVLMCLGEQAPVD